MAKDSTHTKAKSSVGAYYSIPEGTLTSISPAQLERRNSARSGWAPVMLLLSVNGVDHMNKCVMAAGLGG